MLRTAQNPSRLLRNLQDLPGPLKITQELLKTKQDDSGQLRTPQDGLVQLRTSQYYSGQL